MRVPFLYVSTNDGFELFQDIATLHGNNVRFMYACLTRIFRLLLAFLESGSFLFDPVTHRIRHFR